MNAIHIQRLTIHDVVGSGQMGPSINRNCRRSIHFMQRRGDHIDKRPIIRGKIGARTGKQPINQITWLLLGYDCSPGVRSSRWVHPGLQGHSIGKIQRIRVIHRYPAGSIEVESIVELSLAGPGCAADGSCVAVPRCVGHGRSAPLTKTVSCYQTTRRR